MKKIKALMLMGMVVLLAACASAPPQPQGPDLSGNWVLTTESPMGAQDSDMIVQQNGNEITGKISSPMGELDYKGTVNGNDIAFGFSFDAQGMTLQIDYRGVVEGDTMKGTAKFGDFGEGNFTAKRKT